jgi:hypothetical protein
MTTKTRKLAKQAKPPKQSSAARPANQATPAKKSGPAKPQAKSYVLFGTDEYTKPRAAKFSAVDPGLLAKAAEALRLRAVEVKTADEELVEVAARLPAGRLHASGHGLVPYIKGELYSELLAAVMGELTPKQSPEPGPKDLPRSWDEVAPGHLVIARETLEFGWWEAVVIERNGDLVTVRYRDYPDFPPQVRHRSVVALIKPGCPVRRALRPSAASAAN